MTTKTDKFRSVFLAALVVCSVFASTFAFAGSAAAAEDVSISDEGVYEPGETITVSATVNTSHDTAFAVSDDTQLNDTDAVYKEFVNNSTTDTATNETVTKTLDLPSSTGTYYVLVEEENDSDNDSGTTVASTSSVEHVFEIDVEYDDDGATVFAGDTLQFDIDSDEDQTNDNYVLYRNTSSGSDPVRTLSNGSVIEIDTSNLDGGNYYVSDDGSVDFSFGIMAQDFDVSPDETTMENKDDSVTYEITSTNRGETFDVNVTSEQLSDSDLTKLFAAASDENGDAPGVELNVNDGDQIKAELANGEQIATGNYEITFDVVDSDAEETVTLDVTKAGSGQIDFQDDEISVDAGDSENVTVEMANTDNGYVHLGSEDAGYNVFLQVTDGNDDGVVDLTIDTYGLETDEASQDELSDFGISLADESSDDDVSLVTTENNLYTGDERLDAGNYQMSVSLNDNFDQVNNVGMLMVQERSTDAAQTWVTANGSIESADGLLNAIENNEVVQRDNVAQQDRAIVQVQASGIFGYLSDADTELDDYYYDADGAELEAGEDAAPIKLSINQTNPGQNADPVSVNHSAVTQVFASDDKNTVYYVIDTSNLEAGHEFDASFTVESESALNNDEQDQQVSTTFSVEKRTMSFDVNDDDVVEVTSDEKATITGETSIAPGSDVTLYVESEQGAQTPFAMTQTVNVTAGGYFGAVLDFSEQDVGTNFTVEASASPSFDGETSAEGTVVKAGSDDCPKADNSCDVGDDGDKDGDEPSTPDDKDDDKTSTPDDTDRDETSTPDDTDRDETSTPDDTDRDETSTSTSTDDTTATTTPGFGALVALVALVGAALLAVRRE